MNAHTGFDPTTLVLLTQTDLISSLCFLCGSLAEFRDKPSFFFGICLPHNDTALLTLGHSSAKTVLHYSWHFASFPSAMLQQLQVLLLWQRQQQPGRRTQPPGHQFQLKLTVNLVWGCSWEVPLQRLLTLQQPEGSSGGSNLWCLQAHLCWGMNLTSADKYPLTQQTTGQPSSCFDPGFSHIPPVAQGWLLGL